jgi:hypothetical protein
MFKPRFIPVVAALALGGAALSAAPPASAKGGDGVKVGGVCSKNSTSKLKLKSEDRGLEVEFEVDQNRNGVPWKFTLHRSGSLVAAKTAITRGPSGSFSFARVISGTHGKVVAVAARSGERCSATATI